MAEVIEDGALALRLAAHMPQLTLERIGDDGIRNAEANLAHRERGESLAALRKTGLRANDRAVVIAAGPSLHRTDVAGAIKTSGFDGAVIATDSAMRYCLQRGVVPDLVVTLDPHANRIVRWFGDPRLTQEHLAADDYFSRQDMDPAFANEIKANAEMLDLLDRYGRDMSLALSTSASPAVVERAVATGMKIYWWNPMYDDPDQDGVSRKLMRLNRFPVVNAGGNVGAACWMMAHAVLGKSHIALTGMDFSYYDGTPYRNTQYYYEAVDLVGEDRLRELFPRIFNPYLNKWFYTDPAYYWYRQVFLEMVNDAECVTWNCTEGGILFGEGINFAPFEKFLAETASA